MTSRWTQAQEFMGANRKSLFTYKALPTREDAVEWVRELDAPRVGEEQGIVIRRHPVYRFSFEATHSVLVIVNGTAGSTIHDHWASAKQEIDRLGALPLQRRNHQLNPTSIVPPAIAWTPRSRTGKGANARTVASWA